MIVLNKRKKTWEMYPIGSPKGALNTKRKPEFIGVLKFKENDEFNFDDAREMTDDMKIQNSEPLHSIYKKEKSATTSLFFTHQFSSVQSGQYSEKISFARIISFF